jgi:hypothetical protein
MVLLAKNVRSMKLRRMFEMSKPMLALSIGHWVVEVHPDLQQ